MSRRKDGTAMWYDSDLKKMQDNNMGEKFCFEYENPYESYANKMKEMRDERNRRSIKDSSRNGSIR